MENNRPKSRQKNVTGDSKGVKKRGNGLGTGSVRSSSNSSSSSSSSKVTRSSGGKSPLLKIILLVVALLGGGSGAVSLLGGSSDSGQAIVGNESQNVNSGSGLSDIVGSLSGLSGMLNSGTTSSGWELGNNTAKLNTSVASAARDKRTEILGNSQDVVTIMVYMCGTDLESRAGMGNKTVMKNLYKSVLIYTEE